MSVMITKILKTEIEYNDACERLYQLIHSSPEAIEPNSPQGEEMELLSLLIEKYEMERIPIEAPNPIEAIKFRMEQMNLKQLDIAPLFGGKTRISEVLNGRRPLTLRMIALLNKYLGIPMESLIHGNENLELTVDKKEAILKINSIQRLIYKKGKVALT
jgi:HTH-type transcriptional regulator / antitoxin HigA